MAAGDTIDIPSFYVQTSPSWGAGWTTQPYLFPVTAVDCVAPSIGQATFEYDYGRIKKHDQSTFSNYSPYDLNGYYVRIVNSADNVAWWYGRFDTEELQPGGVTGAVRTGHQIFTAWAIEFQLERAPIDWAQASDGSGATVEIDWVPDANKRADAVQVSLTKKSRKRGNRSTSVNTDGVYEFSDDGEEWSNLDLIYMMLNNYIPADAPTFVLGGQYSILDGFHDKVRLDGRTVKEVLDELIDRRRGIGYLVYINGAGYAVIYVFSILESAITLSGTTIPANTDTVTLDFDTSIEILQARIMNSNSVRYDKILIRGNRMLSCFTLSQDDGTQEDDWDSADQTAYDAGGSGVGGYSGLTDDEKTELNDRVRKNDRFKAVYARQRLPRTWNGQVGNGAGGTLNNAIPVCAEDGTITISATPFTPLDKCFEKALPFEEGKDYSGSLPTADPEPTYLKPFALVKDEDAIAARWHYVHDPGEEIKEDGGDASLEIHPSGMAFSIKASPNHIYGKGTYGGTEPSAHEAILSLSRTLATVAMYVDTTLIVSAERAGSPDILNIKSLKIDDAEYWYVAPGTVIGLDEDGALQRVAGALVLRDDRERMWERCAMALAWFGQERRACVVTRKGIYDDCRTGSLIESIFAADVSLLANTILSSRSWDFKGRTTTIETQFIEFDWKEKDE